MKPLKVENQNAHDYNNNIYNRIDIKEKLSIYLQIDEICDIFMLNIGLVSNP